MHCTKNWRWEIDGTSLDPALWHLAARKRACFATEFFTSYQNSARIELKRDINKAVNLHSENFCCITWKETDTPRSYPLSHYPLSPSLTPHHRNRPSTWYASITHAAHSTGVTMVVNAYIGSSLSAIFLVIGGTFTFLILFYFKPKAKVNITLWCYHIWVAWCHFVYRN